MIALPYPKSLQVSEIKWRKRLGIEPSKDAFRRPPTDLKSAKATRPYSLPLECNSFTSSNLGRLKEFTDAA